MLSIGNKKFRNLPEQVGYNTEEIKKIWEVLDGLDVYDNVIILENLDPLTPAQLDIISKPVSFIVYNNQLFMKRGVSGSNVLFDKVFQVTATTVITFDSAEIQVTYPLGTLTYTTNSVATYSTTSIDTMLSAKLDASALLNKTYPVGAVYMSVTNANSPASLFGGTWEELNYDSGAQVHRPVLMRSFNADIPVEAMDTQHMDASATLKWKSTTGSAISTANNNLWVSNNRTLQDGANFVYSEPLDIIAPSNLYAKFGSEFAEIYFWKRVA